MSTYFIPICSIFGAKYFGRFSILMLFLVLACAGFVSVTFSLPTDVIKARNHTNYLTNDQYINVLISYRVTT